MHVFSRLRSRTRRTLLLALALGGVAVVFQNCGQSSPNPAAGYVSPRSPFYEARVRLDEFGPVAAAASTTDATQEPQHKAVAPATVEPLTILIHNSCAVERCADPAAKGLSCSLVANHMREELKGEIQAYDWTPDVPMTAVEIEALLAQSAEDDSCVVGVSRMKEYKLGSFTTNDPSANRQYFHESINGSPNYQYFRDQSLPAVKVGIVDSGADMNHVELRNTFGYNINLSTKCTTICNFHGTFVAGIIAAAANNNYGGHGMTSNVQIISVQIGDSEGRLTTTEIVNGITTAVNQGIDILNLSLGGGMALDFSFQNALLEAVRKNVLIVAAAGNNGKDISKSSFYPASFNLEGQINVGSASPVAVSDTAPPPYNVTGSPIERDAYSNYGAALVHIAAPGKQIFSATHGNGYAVASGTSFSTPMVAAAAAIALGTLKKAGLTPSSMLLKQIVLEGTRREDSMTKTIGGQLVQPFAGNRYLDLSKLKQILVSYTQTLIAHPSRLSLLTSERITVGGQQLVRVRIQINDANVSAGLVIKAYTDKAFVPESDTGLSCQVTMAVQICELDIPYSRMLIDPEVYLTVTLPSGILISDLTIPKTSLNFGERATAAVKGEIVRVVHHGGVMKVEGWACLVGFPDQMKIEIRRDTNTGPAHKTITVSQQGRGNYFTECQAPEVTFGFNYAVPPSWAMGTGSQLYFRAVHEPTGKTLDLQVYKYQPGFADTTPAQFVPSVTVDPAISDTTPKVIITKREFKNWILTIEGSACYLNSRKPASFTVGLNQGDYISMFPQLAPWSHVSLAAPGLASAEDEPVLMRGQGAKWNIPNASARTIDKAGSGKRVNPAFSEIHYPFDFRDDKGEIKPFLILDDEHYATNYGLKTIVPSIDRGDGCAFPSGFSESIDVRPFINQVKAEFAFVWNAAQYETIEEVLAVNNASTFVQIAQGPAPSFSQLVFSPKVLPASLLFHQGTHERSLHTSLFSLQHRVLNRIPASASTPNLFRLKDLLPDLAATFNTDASSPTFGSEGSEWGSNAEGVVRYISYDYNPGFVLNVAIEDSVWGAAPNLTLSPSATTALAVVYTSPEITLPAANSGRLAFALLFTSGRAFGELGTDFVVEMKNPTTGLWHELQVDVIRQHEGSGSLGVDVALSAPISQTQIRIRANGKNDFRITRMGIISE